MSEIVKKNGLTPEYLTELRKLCDNATQVVAWYPHSQYEGYHPGEASVRGPFGRWFKVTGGDNGMKDPVKYPTPVADLYDDASFAAAAMNSLPALLDLIDELQKEKSELYQAIASLKGRHLPDCNFWANEYTSHKDCDCGIGATFHKVQGIKGSEE